MRIISRRILREFWNIYQDSEEPLKAWFQEAIHADWSNPHEVKAMYGNASVIGDNRIVFNIAGNKYRLIVKFNYSSQFGYIRFVGTHAEYDGIDVENI